MAHTHKSYIYLRSSSSLSYLSKHVGCPHNQFSATTMRLHATMAVHPLGCHILHAKNAYCAPSHSQFYSKTKRSPIVSSNSNLKQKEAQPSNLFPMSCFRFHISLLNKVGCGGQEAVSAYGKLLWHRSRSSSLLMDLYTHSGCGSVAGGNKYGPCSIADMAAVLQLSLWSSTPPLPVFRRTQVRRHWGSSGGWFQLYLVGSSRMYRSPVLVPYWAWEE